MASTSSSASFYSTFQLSKKEICDALETNRLSEATQSLSHLKLELKEVLPNLPLYDRGSYQTQIKDLESRVAASRPKSKFAFTKPKPKPSLSTSENESRASTSVSAFISSAPALPHTNTSTSTNAVRFENLENEYITLNHWFSSSSPTSATSSKTIILQSLEGCTIDLRNPRLSPSDEEAESRPVQQGEGITSLHAEGLKRCLLLVDVKGSAMFSGVEDCVLVMKCHQFRIHQSKNTTILLHIPSQPIIEHCQGMVFGRHPNPGSGTDTNANSKHAEVQDFDWVREGPSPNWRSLDVDASADLAGLVNRATTKSEPKFGNLEGLAEVLGYSRRL